jgi:type 1 glutamine amidotransferase
MRLAETNENMRTDSIRKSILALTLALTALLAVPVFADEPAVPKRLLLLGQGPDGHPYATHEYYCGLKIVKKCLDRVKGLDAVLVEADEPFRAGPDLIDKADGVVLFLSEGAKWLQQDEARFAAFERLATRGGAFAGLHWGTGCRDARYVEKYVNLLGGCHGGPDRKYAVVTATTEIGTAKHPIMTGVAPITLEDEFYYRLKFAKPEGSIVPLLRVPIEGESHTVAWAWERPDEGRSFGFTGLHFHRSWGQTAYRRMVTQGILWTLQLPVPADGLDVEIAEEDLKLPER